MDTRMPEFEFCKHVVQKLDLHFAFNTRSRRILQCYSSVFLIQVWLRRVNCISVRVDSHFLLSTWHRILTVQTAQCHVLKKLLVILKLLYVKFIRYLLNMSLFLNFIMRCITPTEFAKCGVPRACPRSFNFNTDHFLKLDRTRKKIKKTSLKKFKSEIQYRRTRRGWTSGPCSYRTGLMLQSLNYRILNSGVLYEIIFIRSCAVTFSPVKNIKPVSSWCDAPCFSAVCISHCRIERQHWKHICNTIRAALQINLRASLQI